jgi:hypothetical protein
MQLGAGSSHVAADLITVLLTHTDQPALHNIIIPWEEGVVAVM